MFNTNTRFKFHKNTFIFVRLFLLFHSSSLHCLFFFFFFVGKSLAFIFFFNSSNISFFVVKIIFFREIRHIRNDFLLKCFILICLHLINSKNWFQKFNRFCQFVCSTNLSSMWSFILTTRLTKNAASYQHEDWFHEKIYFWFNIMLISTSCSS